MPNPLASLFAAQGLQNRQQPTVDALASREMRLAEMRRQPGPNADIGQTAQDIETDPIVGAQPRAELAYNSPFETQQREETQQNALAKLLAPVQMRGEYDLESHRIAGDASVRAAGARAQTTDDLGQERMAQQLQIANANRDATNARSMASQNAVTQRMQQQMRGRTLEAQAKNAETNGPSWLNPLRFFRGEPTGQEQAAQFRSQITQPDQGYDSADSPENIAAEMFQQRPDATPQMIQYAMGQMGVSDPQAIEAIIAAYNQLQGR